MSLSNNFPAIAPSLNLDFANVKALDPRITFTRTTTATYYDGVTTAKAEENLILQSEDFTTSWANTNSTETADTTVAPDGTTTADTITDDATNGSHYVYQNLSISTNTTYVFSCWLKAGTSNYGYLAIIDRANSQRYFVADFDLSTGTVRTSGAGTSGTLTSSSITEFPAGSGWYRCVIIGQVAAVSGATSAVVGVSDGTAAINTFGGIPYVGTSSTIIAWGAQLEQRSAVTAYTPTTTQPITNYIPVLQTAASGVARFDHNPTTGESLGLLVEEQRTNLMTYSEEFDNAAWGTIASSVQANTIVAPDGTLTGEKLVEDGTAAAHGIDQTNAAASFTSGTAYTLSVYAKNAGRGFLQLWYPFARFGSNAFANFNLTTGAVGTVGTSATATITSVGNGWYRCTMTATATGSGTVNIAYYLIDSATAARSGSYTGDGYSGIFLWGAQLE